MPFYAGRIRYESQYICPADVPATAPLILKGLQVPAAEVEVNGRSAGCLAWEPHSIDIAHALKPGASTIVITVHHSLRNLLGPHHHPAGEPVYATPDSFRPTSPLPWMEQLLDGQTPAGWRDGYCVVQLGIPTIAASNAKRN